MTISTQKLYDEASEDWIRKEPTLLSDYTARPFLLDWCQPVAGLDVLDLGCGEGYFARNLKIRGAGNIEGVDLSPEMIQRAVAEESREELGIQYRTGDATELDAFPDDCFDLDGCDAHLEGNIFMHVHQDTPRNSSSNAISTDLDSHLTVIRNLFFDVDHALLLINESDGVFLNNTVV